MQARAESHTEGSTATDNERQNKQTLIKSLILKKPQWITLLCTINNCIRAAVRNHTHTHKKRISGLNQHKFIILQICIQKSNTEMTELKSKHQQDYILLWRFQGRFLSLPFLPSRGHSHPLALGSSPSSKPAKVGWVLPHHMAPLQSLLPHLRILVATQEPPG